MPQNPNHTPRYLGLDGLIDQLVDAYGQLVVLGIAPEGIVQFIQEQPLTQELKHTHARQVTADRITAVLARVDMVKREFPHFQMGQNLSYYMPWRGLSNTVRVHHDFLVAGYGEFKQILPNENGTFDIPTPHGLLTITENFEGMILARVSATNPTVGRRYDHADQTQATDDITDSAPRDRDTIEKTEGVVSGGNEGASGQAPDVP